MPQCPNHLLSWYITQWLAPQSPFLPNLRQNPATDCNSYVNKYDINYGETEKKAILHTIQHTQQPLWLSHVQPCPLSLSHLLP